MIITHLTEASFGICAASNYARTARSFKKFVEWQFLMSYAIDQMYWDRERQRVDDAVHDVLNAEGDAPSWMNEVTLRFDMSRDGDEHAQSLWITRSLESTHDRLDGFALEWRDEVYDHVIPFDGKRHFNREWPDLKAKFGGLLDDLDGDALYCAQSKHLHLSALIPMKLRAILKARAEVINAVEGVTSPQPHHLGYRLVNLASETAPSPKSFYGFCYEDSRGDVNPEIINALAKLEVWVTEVLKHAWRDE